MADTFTIINKQTKMVLETGLNWEDMRAIVKVNPQSYDFMEESTYTTSPEVGYKLSVTNNDFRELTDDETLLERRKLLRESDWRFISDYPGTDQEEWKTYRQSLRDMTGKVFPNKP